MINLAFAAVFWAGLTACVVRYGRADRRLNRSLRRWAARLRWKPTNPVLIRAGKLQIRASEVGIAAVAALTSAAIWVVAAGVWHLDQRWGVGHVLMWQAVAVVTLFVAVVDSVTQLIPNGLLLILGAFVGVAVLVQCAQVWLVLNAADERPWAGVGTVLGEKGLGFLVAAVVFLAVRMISRGGLGAGDIKLYALLGAAAGLTGVIALIVISLLLSAFVGIVLMVLRKRKAKDALPMAPFTFVAVLAAVGLGF
ncbi:MAG: A24 family peptidase [Bifidobacteriaceae bacterium]|jgi:prepilin signal peptidase PulO-like enzyme (type II secretory pathway)|nr:A24 family peptidase [Bifidobacteriaceae bacterium]